MKSIALALVLALAGGQPFGAGPVAGHPQARAQTGTHDGESCPVPNLIGSDRAAAADLLQHARLTTGTVSTRPASEPRGTIIEQRPSPRGQVACGSGVDVIVSAGERETPPSNPESRGGGGSSAVQVGVAVGAAAAIAAIMAARANRGIEVPDLVNQPVASAGDVLTKARLRLGEVTYRESTRASKGVVLEQSPAAGTRVERDTGVTVVASQGPPMTTVPPVAGQRWRDAEATLSGARLRMVTTNPPAGDGGRLVVESQVPEAGTPVVVGGAVAVTLRAQADTTPPAAPVASPPATAAPQPQAPAPGRPDPAQPAPARQPRPAVAQSATPNVPPPAAAPPPAVAAQGVTPQVEPPAIAPPPGAAAPPPPAPAPAPAAGNAPTQIVLVVPPALANAWSWVWLLLLAGVVLVARIRAKRSRQAIPAADHPPPPAPMPPRVTFVPRLDAGRQSFTAIEDRDARSFDLTLRGDTGNQELLYVVDTSGARP